MRLLYFFTARCLEERSSEPASALLRYGLLVVLVATGAGNGAAVGRGDEPCRENEAVQKLLEEGRNAQLPYNARISAYERAIQLCPQDLAPYKLLSVISLKQQDFDTALRWIRLGLEIAPGDPDLNLHEGVALLAAGYPEEALSRLKGLSVAPETEFYLGMTYRSLRDHKSAQRAFSNAFRLGYQDPYALYALIEEDRALGDKEAGLRDFQAFYERFPNSPWIHLLLGNAYLSRHDDRGAESEYQQTVQLDPNLPVVHFQLGFLAFKRAAYSIAEDDFRKEIALDRDLADSYLYLGATLRRLGRNPEALPNLKEAVARDPNSPLAYRELAAAQVEANQIAAAAETLRAAQKRFPQEPAFPAQLAALLRRLGQTDQAKKEADLAESLSRQGNPPLEALSVPEAGKSIEASKVGSSDPKTAHSTNPGLETLRRCLQSNDPKCAESALARIRDPGITGSSEYLDLEAQALALQKKKTEALAAIQRAIQKSPNEARYLLTQGKIYQKFGDQIPAIRSFLQAGEVEPASPEPLYYLGMSFFVLGEYYNSDEYYNRAEPHFKAALERDPQADRAEFMLGVIDVMRNRLTQAKPHFQKAIQMNELNADYHLQYGILLRRLVDFTEALAEMRVAEKLNPAYALVHLNLGSLEQEMGNYREAKEQLEAAVRLNPRLAEAYYGLGGVYHHLGLEAMSKEAYHRFEVEKAHQQEEDSAPLGASSSPVQQPLSHH